MRLSAALTAFTLAAVLAVENRQETGAEETGAKPVEEGTQEGKTEEKKGEAKEEKKGEAKKENQEKKEGHPGEKVESAADARKNLVGNPTFEERGVAGPRGWGMVGLVPGGQEVDGLTSFWVKDGPDGSSCLKYDTDVNLDEAKVRWEEVRKGGTSPAKPKSPTRAPFYDTVAGNDGVNLLGEEIPVKPGTAYDIEADVKTTGTAGYLFVRGYAEIHGEKRILFKYQRNIDESLPGFKAGEWFRVKERNTFHPTRKTPQVKWIRVSLYAYWPPGNMWFDNVAVHENPNPKKYDDEPPPRAGSAPAGSRGK